MVEWIFFDLGSTLLDEDRAYEEYRRRCVEELRGLGLEISLDAYREQMEACAGQGLDPIRASWAHFAPQAPRPLWTNEGVEPYPETREVLETLSQAYPLGIIANQSREVRHLLEEWDLSHYFQVIILSDEIGLAKPDPSIFQLALDKASVPSHQVVYVGDRYDNDILPAKSLGLKTVRLLTGLGRYGPEDQEWQSDWTVGSLKDLLAIFKTKQN